MLFFGVCELPNPSRQQISPSKQWPKMRKNSAKSVDPRRNYDINHSLEVFDGMAEASLHKLMANDAENDIPRIIACKGRPFRLYTRPCLSKCNFVTRSRLHKKNVMSKRFISRGYTDAMFLKGGEWSLKCSLFPGATIILGCSFFVYSWKLPAYS